jgi:hypothetical protein
MAKEEQIILDKRKILLQKGKLERTLVDVPELGGSIWVQEMSAEQRDRFDDWILREGKDPSELRARIVSLCSVDENGKRLFTDLDIPDLKTLPSKAIGRISSQAFRMSGLSEEAVAGIEKNSEAVPNDDSSSDSAES